MINNNSTMFLKDLCLTSTIALSDTYTSVDLSTYFTDNDGIKIATLSIDNVPTDIYSKSYDADILKLSNVCKTIAQLSILDINDTDTDELSSIKNSINNIISAFNGFKIEESTEENPDEEITEEPTEEEPSEENQNESSES